MHPHQQHQEMTLGQQVNLLVFIGQCVSAPLAAFVRRPGTWGCRFVGFQVEAIVYCGGARLPSGDT